MAVFPQSSERITAQQCGPGDGVGCYRRCVRNCARLPRVFGANGLQALRNDVTDDWMRIPLGPRVCSEQSTGLRG